MTWDRGSRIKSCEFFSKAHGLPQEGPKEWGEQLWAVGSCLELTGPSRTRAECSVPEGPAWGSLSPKGRGGRRMWRSDCPPASPVRGLSWSGEPGSQTPGKNRLLTCKAAPPPPHTHIGVQPGPGQDLRGALASSSCPTISTPSEAPESGPFSAPAPQLGCSLNPSRPDHCSSLLTVYTAQFQTMFHSVAREASSCNPNITPIPELKSEDLLS